MLEKLFEPSLTPLPLKKKLILGLQHTFTMFGATVLVPILTGLDISVALFMAGICTLFFHVVTKGQIPIFLGSSFAFIAPIVAAASIYGLEYAQGGIVIAGCMYLILSLLILIFGSSKVTSFFPPVVTGPIIVIIGLTLAPVAISSASENWGLAFVSFATIAFVAIFTKGFLQILPVLCGLVIGYIAAVVTGNVDFTPITEAAWVGFPTFTVARFNLDAVLMIAPVAIVTMVEHIGDVLAVGQVVGKNFVTKPGLHRTLLGDGIATSISAMFGGPANTTYSENTGVLALTRVFEPVVMRIAACFAIALSLFPKLSAVIATIPSAVVGGISIVLFGMIASVGARTLVENNVDFKQPRNLFISAVIFVLGLGGANIKIAAGNVSLTFSGIAIAAIVGIILNKVLPTPSSK